MLRPFTKITIQQIPTPKWTDRNLNFTLDFVTDYEIESGWESHTDTCKIKFPKNIKLLQTGYDGIYGYGSTYNLIQGGSGTENSPNIDIYGNNRTLPPLIMKGDIIIINHGYLFRSNDSDCQCLTGFDTENITQQDLIAPINNDLSTINNLFFGYVSSIGSDTPIEIKCEDNFYLLKRTMFPKSVWNEKAATDEGVKEGTTLYGLATYLLGLVNKNFYSNPDKFINGKSVYPELSLLSIPDSITAQLSLGYLDIGSLTCGEVMNKLKQQYHFDSTFRGINNEIMQFAFPVYIDSDSNHPELNANSNNYFCFRDIYNNSGSLQASANIFPSHDLEYSNKDDVILSTIVQCRVISNLGKPTLSGAIKTKVEKLKVFVYWDIETNTFKMRNLSTGQTDTKVPDNPDGGERHNCWYPVNNTNPNPTIDQLFKYGIEQLNKFHYTGYRGCFTTFGFPFISWNDNVNILDPIYSDRNGQYKVRSVKYRGGIKGLSQEIHLDYKIDKAFNNSNVKSYSLL